MNLIKLQILTPLGIFLEKDVYRIDLKTKSGNIGVLANHIPLVSSLEIGRLQIIDGKENSSIYALHGGLINVMANKATIITSAIEAKDQIDKKRAEIAKNKASKIITTQQTNDSDFKNAEFALKRALTRLNI